MGAGEKTLARLFGRTPDGTVRRCPPLAGKAPTGWRPWGEQGRGRPRCHVLAGEDSGKCVCGACVERLAAIEAWKRSKIFIRIHLKPFKVSTSEGSDYRFHAL